MEYWQNHFKRYILERGYNYAKNGAVTKLIQNDRGVEAIVSGTEDYTVKIDMPYGEIQRMSCSCPYANGGKRCKHLAAVLFVVSGDELYEDEDEEVDQEESYWDDEEENEYEHSSYRSIHSENLKSAIDELSVDDVKELLLVAAYQDHDIARKVLECYEKTELKNELECIFEESYDQNYKSIALHLKQFINRSIVSLIERYKVKDAYQLLKYILMMIDELPIYNDNKDFLDVIDGCFDLILEVIHKAFYNDKNSLITDARKTVLALEHEIFDQHRSAFLEKLTELDPDVKKMKEIDELLKKYEKSTVSPRIHVIGAGLVDAVLYRIELMEKLGAPQQEILEYRKQMRHFSVLRCKEIDEALDDMDTEKALSLIRESRMMDKEDESLKPYYTKKAVEACRINQNTGLLKKELKSLILTTPQFGMENIIEFRNLLTVEEWNGVLPELLKSDTIIGIRFDVLLLSGMSDLVFDEILHFHQFIKYEDRLKQVDIQQTMKLKIYFLDTMAKNANKRSDYQGLVYQLMRLEEYPDGKKEIERIASNWKRMYYKRYAFMEELDRALLGYSF